MNDIFNIPELFIISISPIIGLIFLSYLSKKIIISILIFTIIVFLPAFLGYDFIIPWIYECCLTVFLSFGFFIYFKQIKKDLSKLLTSIFCSIAIGFIVMISAFSNLGNHLGYNKIVSSWKDKSYTIEYILNKGFAGSLESKSYQLYHTPLFGIYRKRIESFDFKPMKNENNCKFYFKKSNIVFDRCNEKFIEAKKL